MRKALLAAEGAALEVAELQKLVMKIFWSATYIAIPPLLLQEAQFVGWLECLLEAVRRPVPQVLLRLFRLLQQSHYFAFLVQ